MRRFTFHRLWAIVLKEFIQMKRDRVTFGMMVGIPLMQLLLFGFAINSDPKHLPTALRMADQGPFARTLVAALRNNHTIDRLASAPKDIVSRAGVRAAPPAMSASAE